VQFDSIRRISLRNFAFAFATFAVSACSSGLYRKVRKVFRKERKQTEPVPTFDTLEEAIAQYDKDFDNAFE